MTIRVQLKPLCRRARDRKPRRSARDGVLKARIALRAKPLRELMSSQVDCYGTMATSSKRSKQDPKRVSSQKHEISYTSGRVAKKTGASKKKARAAVKTAKKQLGRTTQRKKVMARAKKVASR
jgi:hypothetical protein